MSESLKSSIQSDNKADGWSDNAKEYSKQANKVPIVTYFSDATSSLFNKSYPNALTNGTAEVSLLEVCAGPGTFSLSLINEIGINAVQDVAFTITDYSSGMVDAAKVGLEVALPGHTKLNFQVVDVQNIPLSSDTYDVVACMFGYFVPDRMKAFSEVCRVMKPSSGVGIIGTWKFAGLMFLHDEFLHFIGRYPAGEHSPTFVLGNSCSDPVQVTADLKQCGFNNVDIHEPSEVFPIPLSEEFTKGWFNNPMVKGDLENYTFDFLYTEWIRMLKGDKYASQVNFELNVVNVVYTALICFASK